MNTNRLTIWLDLLSPTQGSVLYRSATAWVALAPGTSGHVLVTGGAGADPSWSVGGTANIKQTEIDFGTTPVAEASFTIADADVSPTSQLIGSVAYEAPTGKDLDEMEMDALDLKFGPGSGDAAVEMLPADVWGTHRPVVLRGVSQGLGINFADAALVGGQVHYYNIVWTEE